jgi:hypothetical protein
MKTSQTQYRLAPRWSETYGRVIPTAFAFDFKQFGRLFALPFGSYDQPAGAASLRLVCQTFEAEKFLLTCGEHKLCIAFETRQLLVLKLRIASIGLMSGFH